METENQAEAKRILVKAGQKCSLCTCGTSKALPYCDDSHKKLNDETGSSFRPVKVWPEKDVELKVWCGKWEKKL